MHDPSTVAFEIKFPWYRTFHGRRYFAPFITIWHEDPEKDGTDDSCGWFMRARHGDPKVREAIRGDYEFNWDADYGGWFDKEGKPKFAVSSIVIGMFWGAAFHHFGKSARKTRLFMRKHLFDILHFAENPVDSAASAIGYRFHERDREDRIAAAEAMIYGCVLRWTRPWYRHPRWHVHHWRFQIHPLQKLRRRLFVRCCHCGNAFGWNESPIGTWGGDRLWHQRCDRASGGIVCEPVKEPARCLSSPLTTSLRTRSTRQRST